MKRNMFRHGNLVLAILTSTLVPHAFAKNNPSHGTDLIHNLSLIKRAYYLEDEPLATVVQHLPPKSPYILSEDELQHIGWVAEIADLLVVESQKTVDKMLDSLDKTPLSYFSDHALKITTHMIDVTKMLEQHIQELPADTPETYARAITLSIDLFGIVTKYLRQLHAILVNSKVNSKALKLAKALEKSSGALEKVYVKALKKLTLLIKHLNTLGLIDQVNKLQVLKDRIDENYKELTDPAGVSIAQNMQMVYALDVKIAAEKNKKRNR